MPCTYIVKVHTYFRFNFIYVGMSRFCCYSKMGFQKCYVIFRVGHVKCLRLLTRWVGGVKKGPKHAYVIFEWSLNHPIKKTRGQTSFWFWFIGPFFSDQNDRIDRPWETYLFLTYKFEAKGSKCRTAQTHYITPYL